MPLASNQPQRSEWMRLWSSANMSGAMPSMAKNALAITAIERAPLSGQRSSIAPVAMSSSAYQVPATRRVHGVVTIPASPLARNRQLTALYGRARGDLRRHDSGHTKDAPCEAADEKVDPVFVQ